MYVILIFALACLLGWLLWRRLCRTHLLPFLRALLTLLCIVVSYIVLFWISIYISIHLFQMNDPIS